jgi:hypothetical protein
MTKIMMNSADLEIINKVVEENAITQNFCIIYNNNSGIGYTLDLQFTTEVNGREATVTIPICGEENW